MTTEQLAGITLAKGGHTGPERGMCLLEAVSWINGDPFTDHPECVSPVLGAYGRSLNDVLPDDKRQLLVPFIPRLIGTAGDDAADQVRGLMAADWLIRVYTPAWLRLAGLDEAAGALEGLERQVSWDDVAAAVPVLRDASRQASAAGVAAGVAAGDAAGVAAWVAAGVAAGDAAGDAAWVAAGDAAGDAACDAARTAARTAVNPTRDQLQDSAIELFDFMINAGQVTR